MKHRILTSAIVGLFCWGAVAQTADDWVTQGRASMTSHDITSANAFFLQALALNPNHPTANALYAVTRLLVLPNQPTGSYFLTRLGFPAIGRNLYAWTSEPPKDAKNIYLAPAGVNANELTTQLRTNILPVVVGAIANLSVITDTNFTLELTSGETASIGVTVDYGDIKMFQAGLYGASYVIYMVNAQNLDAQLTAIRAIGTDTNFSAARALADYPQLLSFATTNDMQAALTAFTNAVNAYEVASAFIRSRPVGAVRLFNLDSGSVQGEADFRSGLEDAKSSLAGAQVLNIQTNYTVNMKRHFDGSTPWRSLLPRVEGNAIVLGSIPDLTLGGVVGGISQDFVESALGNQFVMLPVGNQPVPSAGGLLQLPFNTLRGHNYSLQASTNLVNWDIVTNFVAASPKSVLADWPGTMSLRYYRLQDYGKVMVFSGIVLDQMTGMPVAGALFQSVYDGRSAVADVNGQFVLNTTIKAPGFDNVQVSATGYMQSYNNYYSGNGMSGMTIYLSPQSPPPAPSNDNFANRTALSGANLSVRGYNVSATQESGEQYKMGSHGGHSVWWSWTAPQSGYVTVSTIGSNFDTVLDVYTGSSVSALTPIASDDDSGGNLTSKLTFAALGGVTYQISVDGFSWSTGAIKLNISMP